MTKPNLRIVPPAPAAASPLLKWAGGKRTFVKEYGDDMFTHVIENGGRYFEPFLGGAAMALHLGIGGMVLGDVEEELLVTYTIVRDDPEGLITMLDLVADGGTDKEAYYRIRAATPTTEFEEAARVIYLNKFCFNGLYRKNKDGGFNVPYGGNPGRKLPTREQIMEASQALAGTELRMGDFEQIIEQAGNGDTLYIDPPYHGTFVDYTAHGFGDHDQERLTEALRAAVERGATFFAHNADTVMVRELYNGFDIFSMPERRMINSKGAERGEVPCVLIVGGV